jgi:BASS family bile acid:Na+ symporter
MISIIFKISLAIFIASNLLDLGLRLNLKDAGSGLKNLYFTGHTLVWGFMIGPGLALLIINLFPLEPSYAVGLLLLSMTPGAPFLPMVMEKVKADLGYTAAFMVIVSITTVLFMPMLVPNLIPGLAISSWTLAQPLFIVMLVPFIVGMLTLNYFPASAYRIEPVMRKVKIFFAILACVLCVLVYGESLLEISPGWTLSSLIIFFFLITVLPYWFGFGLVQDEKLVLSVGLATRNLGATVAPLLLTDQIDQRAIIMIGLGLPVMLFFAWFSMKLYNRSLKFSKPVG